MSAKKHNKLPTQPNRLPIPKVETVLPATETKISPLVEIKKVDEVKKEDIYQPSVNADKYPTPEPPKIQYKLVASRNDYVKLQDDVSKLLQEGWVLAGGVCVSASSSPYETVQIFAQALTKN